MISIRLTRYCIAALAIGAGICAEAQTIDELVQQIVENNLDLQSRALNIKADKYDADDANALSNPEVGFTRVWGKDGIGNKLQLDISQSFDWPGVYRSRSQANDMGEAAAWHQLLADRLDVAVKAKQTLVELVYLRKQKRVLGEMIGSMQRLNSVISNSLEKGQITVLDDKKTKMETYKYENQLAMVDTREQEVMATLQSMAGGIGIGLGEVLEYPIERLMSLQEYHDIASSIDPAVTAGNITARQNELNAKVSAMSRFPSFTVGYEHQNELGDRFNGFTLGMTLPFFENRHGKKANMMRQAAAEKAVEQTIADNTSYITSIYSAMTVWKERMEQYRSLFGDNVYLELLRKAYDGGELTVIDFINETNYYLDNTLAYLEMEYNYYASLSDLNKYNLLGVIDNPSN